MTTYLVLAGAALAVILAVALWRLLRPGRGAVRLACGPAVPAGLAGRVRQYLGEKFAGAPANARLTRAGEAYQLGLIGPPGRPGAEQEVGCEVLAAGLADDVFGGAAVEVHLCDEAFRPLAVVRHQGRFGRRLVLNAAQLFTLDGVSDAQALNVATFLAAAGLFNDSPKVAQLEGGAGGYEFRLAVEVDPLTPEMTEGQRRLAHDLSRHVLGGAPVTVRYCKGLLGTLRAGPPRAAGDGPPAGPYRAEVYRGPGAGG